MTIRERKLPSISIVTCTLNPDLRMFEKTLRAIKLQQYPKKLIEHIVRDGGSEKETLDLIKKYNCKLIHQPQLKNFPAKRMSLGIKEAKNEFILILEPDNIMVGKDWLSKMVEPFMEDKNVSYTFSAYNAFEKDMDDTTKYCALFGIPDPTLYYLGKSEKIRMDQKRYNKGTLLKERKRYWIVKFNKNNLPTLGDNGHMFRKNVINKVNKDSNNFVHVDACREMLEMGYDTCGVVKNSIIHTVYPTISKFVKQRVGMKQRFYDKRRNSKDRYATMDWKSPKDIFNIAKFIIYSITFVVPFIESLKGYFYIKERAWFLHPVISFLMVIGYGISEIKWMIKKGL